MQRDGSRGSHRDAPGGAQIDNSGRFAFVEDGGRLAWLHPDGEIATIAGWTLKAHKDPVWIRKNLTVIRRALAYVCPVPDTRLVSSAQQPFSILLVMFHDM